MFTQLKRDLMERGVISEYNFLVRCLAYAASCFLAVFFGMGNFNYLEGPIALLQSSAVITSSFSELKPVGNDDPALAFGLSGLSDYGESMPYIDLMHMARKFSGTPKGQHFGTYTNKMLKDNGYLDAAGWPIAIPPELESVGTIWAYDKDITYGGAKYRTGTYVLTYEGEGTIKLALSAKVVSSAPGTIIFTSEGGAFSLSIVSTDPLKNGNYIRNISIIKKENVALFKAGAIFNPDYIAKIKDARQIRFMDAMETNGSTMVDWSEMPTENDVSWKPMPISIQVRLANEIGADPWFNIPFHANDEFIRNFATYVRDHLDPKLVASVEYSNEVWNFSFDQAQDALKLAEVEYGVKGGPGWMNYYGQKASQVMKIWTEVFGSETKTRLIRVVGAQTGSESLLTNTLEAPIWQKIKPAEYDAPYKHFDAVAITTYFGNRFIQDAALIDQVLSKTTPEAQNELHSQLLTSPQTLNGKITFTQKSKMVTTSVPVAGLSGFEVAGTFYKIDASVSSTTLI